MATRPGDPDGRDARDDAAISSALAELSVIADLLDRQRSRVASLAEPFLGSDRDDVVTAIHEAERELMVASRTLARAIKTIRG